MLSSMKARLVEIDVFPMPQSPLDCRVFAPASPVGQAIARRRSIRHEAPPWLDPVVMVESDGGAFLVDGHRRLRAAQRSGKNTVPAVVYPKDTPREAIAARAIAGRLPGISGAERAVMAERALRFLRSGGRGEARPGTDISEEEWRILTPLFPDASGPGMTARLLPALAIAEDELAAMHALALPPSRMIPLVELTAGERRALLIAATRFPITSAETRRLVDTLRLLRGRDAFDPVRWVTRAARRAPDGARADALIDDLARISHPTLRSRLDRLERALAALRLPPGATIRPPENLEGSFLSCYFRFSSAGEFDAHLERLHRAAEAGDIERALDALND